MSSAEVATTLAATHERFAQRHRDLDATLERNCATVTALIDDAHTLSPEHRLLVGAYFTHEYAIEAAALANPSMVPAPDQSGLGPGEQRFVLSLRAIGEGHLSSIEFRSGVIDTASRLSLDAIGRFPLTGQLSPVRYDRAAFRQKLAELGVLNQIARRILDPLESRFTLAQLEAAIGHLHKAGVDRAVTFETTRIIHWVAASNYTTRFAEDTSLSERVLFPSGPAESHGMEDARFVRFIDEDGTIIYFATYTAFDGFQILPQLIETTDFISFRVATLNGEAARNKGMALFPRKVGGRFAALGRQDNESNFVMFSDDVRKWQTTTQIQQPERPWELMQLGNCGSPIETDAGWLVITHAVGPMRRYTLGAVLLDINDPRRVIGHLDTPLLEPSEEERDGYVPNVVYSCGSMVHGEDLVIPYGLSDLSSGIAVAPLREVLARLTT